MTPRGPDLNAEQQAPKKGEARPTWELVVEDMKRRDRLGFTRYGLRLTSDNGRAHLRDAYQEALDLAVYLRAQIDQWERMRIVEAFAACKLALDVLEEPTPDVARKYQAKAALRRALGVTP